MSETSTDTQTGLKIVDAYDLDDELRAALRPGEMLRDQQGRRHRLPRYFYEVSSHEDAAEIHLTPHFGLNELTLVDIREHPRLVEWPRYVPCAIRHLALYLERFRDAVGATVHVSVNGGYRSPGHELSHFASHHMWGTAADIYRIGSTILRDQETIEKYNAIARSVADSFQALPFGHGDGQVDDHIHLDIGFLIAIPDQVSEDRMEVPQEQPRFAFEDRRSGDRRRRESGSTVEPGK